MYNMIHANQQDIHWKQYSLFRVLVYIRLMNMKSISHNHQNETVDPIVQCTSL